MSDIKYTITEVHISKIRPGDTIERNGGLWTVCRSNIKKGFMGRTLFGDCYKLGTELVKRAEIFHAR